MEDKDMIEEYLPTLKKGWEKFVKKLSELERDIRTRISEEELFSRIQKRAYEFYEKRSGQQGNDMDDWTRAEEEVRREVGLPKS